MIEKCLRFRFKPRSWPHPFYSASSFRPLELMTCCANIVDGSVQFSLANSRMNVCASSYHKQLSLSFSSANILYFFLHFWMYKGNCSFFLTCVILVYPLAKHLFF